MKLFGQGDTQQGPGGWTVSDSEAFRARMDKLRQYVLDAKKSGDPVVAGLAEAVEFILDAEGWVIF